MRVLSRLVTKLSRAHACWRERTPTTLYVTLIDPPIGGYTHLCLWDDTVGTPLHDHA